MVQPATIFIRQQQTQRFRQCTKTYHHRKMKKNKLIRICTSETFHITVHLIILQPALDRINRT